MKNLFHHLVIFIMFLISFFFFVSLTYTLSLIIFFNLLHHIYHTFHEHNAVHVMISRFVLVARTICFMSKWTTFVMSMVLCCHVILMVWFVPCTQIQRTICPQYTNTRIEGCNSMTKQIASCTNYIYRRDQRRFTIIEDQNNHLVSMSIHLHVH